MGEFVWVMAFIGGVVGTLVGTTTTFIIYGIMGILSQLTQPDIFFTTYIQNVVFVPCVCFTGAVAATAFAAKKNKYNISGSGRRSLYFASDLSIYMVGGCFGVIGYGILRVAEHFSIPIDTGALSVLLVGIIIRKFLIKETMITCTPKHIRFVGRYIKMNWVNTFIIPVVISLLVASIVVHTGNVFICFYISAASLIFLEVEPQFPVTHQVTLVSAYAASQFSSIQTAAVAAIAFGILAQLIFEIISVTMNYGIPYDEKTTHTKKLKSHIDAPAVAMAILSCIIFTYLG